MNPGLGAARRGLRACVLAVTVAFACAPGEGSRAWGEHTPHRMVREVAGQQLRYWLYTPSDWKTATELPLLLFLHGSGERGEDLAQVKVHGPPALIGRAEELADFVVVSPQCPDGEWWQSDTLVALVGEVMEAHSRIDPDRLYVTGLSMGGYGTWSLIVDYPELFAAAVPICGGGDPDRLNPDPDPNFVPSFRLESLEGVRDLPIWAFHGEDDSVVPVAETLLLVEALRELGSDVRLTTYPGVGHDSWTQTYARADVYEWLLEQERP